MVDIAAKDATRRRAFAYAKIQMKPDTLELVKSNAIAKGDVLSTARIAAIMGAKRTSTLIPLCHPLAVSTIEVSFMILEEAIAIKAEVAGIDRSGFEMEALTAAGIAALTIYDMCKGHDKEMVISEIYLHRKSGGKSGEYTSTKEALF